MNTSTATVRDRRLDRFRDETAAGVTAGYFANSNLSADRMNRTHMATARGYGATVAMLGNLATLGDVYAAAVAAALPKVSPWLTDYQIAGGIAEAFSAFIRAEWTDVREATGPEAGRPSSHRRSITLVEAVVLQLALVELGYLLGLGRVPGPGWGIAALAHETGAASIISRVLPRTSDALA